MPLTEEQWDQFLDATRRIELSDDSRRTIIIKIAGIESDSEPWKSIQSIKGNREFFAALTNFQRKTDDAELIKKMLDAVLAYTFNSENKKTIGALIEAIKALIDTTTEPSRPPIPPQSQFATDAASPDYRKNNIAVEAVKTSALDSGIANPIINPLYQQPDSTTPLSSEEKKALRIAPLFLAILNEPNSSNHVINALLDDNMRVLACVASTPDINFERPVSAISEKATVVLLIIDRRTISRVSGRAAPINAKIRPDCQSLNVIVELDDNLDWESAATGHKYSGEKKANHQFKFNTTYAPHPFNKNILPSAKSVLAKIGARIRTHTHHLSVTISEKK
jgi:hypothetical protein